MRLQQVPDWTQKRKSNTKLLRYQRPRVHFMLAQKEMRRPYSSGVKTSSGCPSFLRPKRRDSIQTNWKMPKRGQNRKTNGLKQRRKEGCNRAAVTYPKHYPRYLRNRGLALQRQRGYAEPQQFNQDCSDTCLSFVSLKETKCCRCVLCGYVQYTKEFSLTYSIS